MLKNVALLSVVILLSACNTGPKETYPYDMSEKEWNELSIKDKANIRRDFYFYEKGTINFVNPQMEIEGKQEPVPNMFMQKKKEVKKPVVTNTSEDND